MKRHSTTSKGRPWWAAQVAAYEKSGLTQRAYCEAHGLSRSTFGKWRRRLLRDTGETAITRPPASFVEVELPSAPLVRVSLGTVTVDFETLPPPAWVAELAARGGPRC